MHPYFDLHWHSASAAAIDRQAIIFSYLLAIYLSLRSLGELRSGPLRAASHGPTAPCKIGHPGMYKFRIHVFYRLCILLRISCRRPRCKCPSRACCCYTSILSKFFRRSTNTRRSQIFCFVPNFLCKYLC